MAYKGGAIMSFKNKIEKYFSYLFERWGFEFVDLEDDYGGNIVVAQSDELKIRFINDRADFFLDISRIEKPDSWIGFYEIIDQLNARGGVNIEYKYANKIGAVSRLLDKCFPEIQIFFSE
jgi:hypothetical protein